MQLAHISHAQTAIATCGDWCDVRRVAAIQAIMPSKPLGAKHMAKVEREYRVNYENANIRPHWQPLIDKAKAHYRAGKDALAELQALVNADYTSDGLPSDEEALARFGFDGHLRIAIAKRKPGYVAKSNGSTNELAKYLSNMRQSGRAT
jgi:hypothetical protein